MLRNESLPYFGKINSISRIIKVDNDEGRYYLVKRYDANGKEKKEDFISSINLKNTKGILEDYCRDVRDYLTKNESKYIEYRKKKKIFNFDISLDKLNLFDKLSKVGVCLGTVLLGLTFSVVSIPVIFYTGMLILVVGGIGLVVVSDINKELEQSQFVSEYDICSRKMNEYKSYLDNNLNKSLTSYNGISKTENMGNTLKKTRVLKPKLQET